MTGYLKYLPRPLLDDIISNSCIPIIGAGFSKNADLPRGKNMPEWDELGHAFAEEMTDYTYTNSLDSISAYSYEFSRPKLVEKLIEFLHVMDCKPSSVHESFCRIPFDLVCTTNFDFLLEKGYEKIGKYHRPIIEEDQLTIGTRGFRLNGSEQKVNLLKLHGDIHHPNRLVVTEQDYDSFLTKYPLISTYLANLLITRTPLFIGYSIDDPDFRQVWQLIKDRLGNLSRPAYTIAVNANPSYIAKFNRRGVKVINIPGRGYKQVLVRLFEEIRDYWIKNIPQRNANLREETIAELTLPPDAKGRLCYFAASLSIQSFYKSYIYPIAEQYGFTPISMTDIVTIGDNIAAKIASIVERSELIIIDAENDAQLVEIKIALRDRKKSPKVLIVEREDRRNSSFVAVSDMYMQYISRSENPFLQPEPFIHRLEDWFKSVAEDLRPMFFDEPLRLLSKKEYNPAVVSAITLLETSLRKQFEHNVRISMSGAMPLSRLISQAIEYKIIPYEFDQRLKEWIQIRNGIVHNQTPVSYKTATQIVNGITEIVRGMDQVAGTKL